MTKTDILEQLYDRLPNREADNLIDMLLEDESNLDKALQFLEGKPEKKLQYNLFAGIENKPIYKTVAKFMDDELEEPVQVLKMLSSILTQIFIQCELRSLNPGDFNLVAITDAILRLADTTDLDNSIVNDIKSIIIDLGYNRQ